MAEQRMVKYAGTVQGVGFRWQARNLASGYDVAGYVRNLPGGEVELVAEGEAEELERFLAAVRARLSGCIRRETAQRAPASGEYCSFEIRH